MADKSDLDYYEVGSTVRDDILGVESETYNYVVLNETEEGMMNRGFDRISSNYPTFKDNSGHKYTLAMDENGELTDSLVDDLKRRDFTINSMAKKDEDLIDPFDGKDDLKSGVIRANGSLEKDPIRVLRMARLAARFDFDIDSSTKRLAKRAAFNLEQVPNENIGKEFIEAMRQSSDPSKFFDSLREVSAYKYISEHINGMTDSSIPAGPDEYHREGSLWQHTMNVVDEVYEENGNDVDLLLCAFFHDIGKVLTPRSEYPNHYGHDKEGADIVRNVCSKELRLPNRLTDKIEMACRQHMRVKIAHDMKYSKVLRLVDDLEKRDKGLSREELLDLAQADDRGSIGSGKFDRSQIEKVMSIAEDAMEDITGDKVMSEHDIEPGEKVSDVLLQERVKYIKNNV